MACSRCNSYKIKLMPDYSSTGVWCGDCGLGTGDVEKEYPMLEQELIDSIECWNLLWDLAQNKKGLNKERFSKIFRSMGSYLANQIIMESSSCYFGEFDKTQKLFLEEEQ